MKEMNGNGDAWDEVMEHFKRLEEASKKIKVDKGYISIHVENDYHYEIPLQECETVWGAIEWLHHLTEKTWMNEEMLWYIGGLMSAHAKDAHAKSMKPKTGHPHQDNGL